MLKNKNENENDYKRNALLTEINELKQNNAHLLKVNEFILSCGKYLTPYNIVSVVRDNEYSIFNKLSFNLSLEEIARLVNDKDSKVTVYCANSQEDALKNIYSLIWRADGWTCMAKQQYEYRNRKDDEK